MALLLQHLLDWHHWWEKTVPAIAIPPHQYSLKNLFQFEFVILRSCGQALGSVCLLPVPADSGWCCSGPRTRAIWCSAPALEAAAPCGPSPILPDPASGVTKFCHTVFLNPRLFFHLLHFSLGPFTCTEGSLVWFFFSMHLWCSSSACAGHAPHSARAPQQAQFGAWNSREERQTRTPLQTE